MKKRRRTSGLRVSRPSMPPMRPEFVRANTVSPYAAVFSGGNWRQVPCQSSVLVLIRA